MISLEEFAKRQDEAMARYGRYVRDVIEWALYCPDDAEPDPKDYFDKPLGEHSGEASR